MSKPQQHKGRIPPQSIEAEQNLLGSCLLSQDALADAIAVVKTMDFYRQAHQVIFQAMLTLFDKGEPVSMVSVVNELQAGSKIDQVGGATYIASLTDVIFTISQAASSAKIIRNHAVLRRMITCGTRMVELCYQQDRDIDTIIASVESELFAASAADDRSAASMAEVSAEVLEAVRLRQNKTGKVTGLETGFDALDNMTTGLHKSELTIIAARPSMGKSAFAINIATNAAKQGVPTIIYSIEMARGLLGERILSEIGSVNSMGIRNGNLNPLDFDRLLATAAESCNLPLYIDDTPYMNITDLRIRSARMHAKNKIGLILVDYMQLMDGRSNKKREQQVAEISRGLKGIARDLNIPVIALSQLNRGLENRADKRPMLSDLRESGAIEQDADNILFLYREDYYRKPEDNYKDHKATIILAKQRNGPTGDLQLYFDGAFSRFSNPDETDTELQQNYQPWLT